MRLCEEDADCGGPKQTCGIGGFCTCKKEFFELGRTCSPKRGKIEIVILKKRKNRDHYMHALFFMKSDFFLIFSNPEVHVRQTRCVESNLNFHSDKT